MYPCIKLGFLSFSEALIARLFCQDFMRADFDWTNSLKWTGLFFIQNPWSSVLKSGKPDAVLKPAPDKIVIIELSFK